MIKIALYDDNESYRTTLAQSLGTLDHVQVVGQFPDCRFIREQIETHCPNLLLMDIDMPHVNGLQGLYLVKSHFPNIKVLMLTIFDEDDKIFESICLGADGYLMKHSSPERIGESLQQAIEGGAPMTPIIARKVLNVFQKSGFKAPVNYELSEKELQVLKLLVEGNSYKMIASEQNVSINTIRTQVRSVYEKLRVHSVSEAVAKAIREQIV